MLHLMSRAGIASLCALGVVIMAAGFAVADGASGSPGQEASLLEQQMLFHSGEGSYFCIRIPALVVTSKGTVIAFAEARRTNCSDSDQIDLVYKRSVDGGRTWGPLQVLEHEGTHSMNQPTPVLDSNTGVLWFVFCEDNQRVFVTHTSDDGITWAPRREITDQVKDPDWKYIAAGPGHGIQLSSGRLLVAAWGDASPGPASWPSPIRWGQIEFTFTMFSDDDGRTWQRGRPMYENLSEEAMVVETASGPVYITLRQPSPLRTQGQKRGHAWSTDGGYSWSRIQFDDALPDPHVEGSIIRIPGKGGGSEDRFLLVSLASEVDRSHLTVRLSEDNLKTWPISKLLCEGSSGYSDLALANDNTILCLYEADHVSKILLARFNLAWLTAGAASK